MDWFKSFNVIEVLKFGVPGLLFLLSAVAAWVLHKTPNASEAQVRVINRYLVVNVLLALLGVWSARQTPSEASIRDADVRAIGSAQGTPGFATVCRGSGLEGRYVLLVSRHDRGRMLQVMAGSMRPCGEPGNEVTLSSQDLLELGGRHDTAEIELKASAALPGFMFVMQSKGSTT